MRIITDVQLSPHIMPGPRVDSSAAKTAGAQAGKSTAIAAQGIANVGTSQTSALYPASSFWGGGIANIPIPSPSDPNDPRKKQDVALLDQAEGLAQDAYRKLSQSNPTAADKAAAQQEMQQAEQIRNQVRPDLTPDQQQTLDVINSEEKQSIADETAPGGLFDSILTRGFSVSGMVDGASRSKGLDNSILGLPQPAPPFPWFGQLGNLF